MNLSNNSVIQPLIIRTDMRAEMGELSGEAADAQPEVWQGPRLQPGGHRDWVVAVQVEMFQPQLPPPLYHQPEDPVEDQNGALLP